MAAPLIGAPFKQEVRRQLEVRSKKRASRNLTDKDLAVQHGSTGWARISSGVVIEGDGRPAEENILQGGILNKLNKGFGEKATDSSYTKDAALGYRPIPGVESIEIVTQNDQGTIRKTDVAFKVNSLDQLETFERLYLRPGYTLLLEYGHSSYYDNDENIISNVPSVIDFFNTSSRIDIAKKIEELKKSSDYNYDAILGFCMNFQYSFNMEGGYDCTFYIISAGSILESIKMLTSGNTRNIKGPDSSQLDEVKSNLTTLGNMLAGKEPEAPSMDNTSTVLKLLNKIYFTTGQRDPQLDTLKEKFKIGLNDVDKPYYLHDVSTDIKNAGKKVYITFSTFFKILNNTINMYVNNKTSALVKFGYNEVDPINSTFLTYDNHISSNPHVCLLKKRPANKKLDFAAGVSEELFPRATSVGNQIYSDILLDVSFLSRTLSDLSDAPESDRTIVDYIKNIFEKIQPALGGINEFDFHYLENYEIGGITEPATLFIVDRKITPSTRDLRGNVLPCYGKGGLLSNISVTSKISNDIMNMMAIAAQQSATDIDNKGLPLFSFNVGLTDRFKGDMKAQDQESTDESEKEYNEKIEEIEKAVETFVGGRTFMEGDGKGLEQTHNFISKQDIKLGTNPNPGILPFELTFSMQGIAGLVIGQGFKLQEGILPSYIQKTAGFIIKSINHSISGNAWTTDISAYMCISEPDPEKIVKTFEQKELKTNIKDRVDNYTDKGA